MAQPLYRQLLRQASRLARLDPRRPQQANLRRAVSSAYYAMFHFLVDQSCRFLVGSARRRAGFRTALTRAYVHNEMGTVAKVFAAGALPSALSQRLGPMVIPPELSHLAEQFAEAQQLRQLADYDVAETFLREDVIKLVDRIEQAIAGWATIRTDPASRFFLLALLIWHRIRDK